MRRYLIRRLATFVPALLGLSIVVFVLLRVIPGDIVDAYLALSEGGVLTKQEQEALAARIRSEVGLDRPLHVQYVSWIGSILRGDLGKSYWQQRPVREVLGERLPLTVQLGLGSILVAVLWAVPLGIASATRRDTWLDYTARVWSVSGISVPSFWLGIMVIFVAATYFNWLPPLRFTPLWEDPGQNLAQLAFPTLILGYGIGAPIARLTRAEVLEVLYEDYVRTARSKGLAHRTVLLGHVLKNALLPVVTFSGWTVARLIGGAVVTERVFNLPGVGSLLLGAITQRDYEIVGSTILTVAGLFLVVNLVVDLLYVLIDPRVRLA